MTFMDKKGALKLRYLPLVMVLPAIGGISYGAGLGTGAAFGLFFLCFMSALQFIGLAMLWDKIQEIEHRLGEVLMAGPNPP